MHNPHTHVSNAQAIHRLVAVWWQRKEKKEKDYHDKQETPMK
jgi:hypothetical protein